MPGDEPFLGKWAEGTGEAGVVNGAGRPKITEAEAAGGPAIPFGMAGRFTSRKRKVGR